jgi:hypothetical protein
MTLPPRLQQTLCEKLEAVSLFCRNSESRQTPDAGSTGEPFETGPFLLTPFPYLFPFSPAFSLWLSTFLTIQNHRNGAVPFHDSLEQAAQERSSLSNIRHRSPITGRWNEPGGSA